MRWSRFSKLFAQPTALELAHKELSEAERLLLVAQAGQEWAHANVEYNKARIQRLRAYIIERASCDPL